VRAHLTAKEECCQVFLPHRLDRGNLGTEIPAFSPRLHFLALTQGLRPFGKLRAGSPGLLSAASFDVAQDRLSGAGVGWFRSASSPEISSPAHGNSRSLHSARFRSAPVGMTESCVGLTECTRKLESGLEFAGFGETEFALGQVEGQEFFDLGFFAVAGHG